MASIVDKKRLPQELDRRRKLSYDDIDKIKYMRHELGISLNAIAREFRVSKKTILLYTNPLSMKKNQEYIKNNWKKYQYDKDGRREAVRHTRAWKKEHIKELIDK